MAVGPPSPAAIGKPIEVIGTGDAQAPPARQPLLTAPDRPPASVGLNLIACGRPQHHQCAITFSPARSTSGRTE